MKLADAHKQFLEHCGSTINLSHHTLRAYKSDLNDALKYFGLRKRIESFSKDDLRHYISHLREHDRLKETTIKRRLACMRLLFKWATQEALIEASPFDSLNVRIRLPKRLPRALDRQDRARLRQAIKVLPLSDDFEAIRNKTAINLLLDTAIRVGELVQITLKDLSLNSGHIVINGKGNRQRLVYLPQKPLIRQIERYLASRSTVSPKSERLFLSSRGKSIMPPCIRVALRSIAQTADLSKHVTPHMLRHTCATEWLEAGLDIRYVQRLLGHQSISTTEIYAHASDQGLREALIRATERKS